MTEQTARKRANQNIRLKSRLAALEQALTEVWRWTTFDGKDIEGLRGILLNADKDAELNEKLDRLGLSTKGEGPNHV
jgi:hypothetical protein